MKLFRRARSGANQPEQFSNPQSAQKGEESPIAGRRLVLGNPKDKYGMVDLEERELPSPAFNGVQAIAEERQPERTPAEEPLTPAEETGGETEDGDEYANDGTKKKKKKGKKKKKKSKKKKKKATSENVEDDDMPIVVDRVPTAMEYESDDSIEKMIDERSRYSRYTTEHDELDLDTFDDGDSEGATDKYAGAGTIGQIVSVLSDESNPPVWRSWDDDEEKKEGGEPLKKRNRKKKESKKKSSKSKVSNSDKFSVEEASTQDQSQDKSQDKSATLSKQSAIKSKPSSTEMSEKSKSRTGHSAIRSKPSGAEMSGKSRGSRKKKYQDLREFRKSHSPKSMKDPPPPAPEPNLEEEVYTPYTLPDFNAPAAVQKDAHVEKSDSASQQSKQEKKIGKKSSADQADNNSRRSQDSKTGSQNSRDLKTKKAKKGETEVPVSRSQSWIAYDTFSGTFEKSKASTIIPPVVSDTSSLTDPLKKHEKYAALMALQPTINEEGGPPREIAAAKKTSKSKKDAIRNQSLITSWSTSKDTASANGMPVGIQPVNVQPLSVVSSGSSDRQVHNRYSVAEPSPASASAGFGTWVASPMSQLTGNDRMKELDKRLGEINETDSGSNLSSSKVRRSKTGTKLRDRYQEIKGSHSNNTETRTNVSSPKHRSHPLSKKQNDAMYNHSLMNEEESSYATDSMQRSSGDRTKKAQMKELDEYSVAISVQDDPALVQCLRFYQCAAAASIAGFASGWLPSGFAVKKEVKMLGREDDFDEVDKMRFRDGELGPMTDTVEVLLEHDEENSSLGQDQRDDATIDAPDLKAVEPNVNSYLREVTSLSLRLDDGGFEEKRQQPALDRGRAMAAEAEVDLNIKEIAIPHSSSIKIQKRLVKQKQLEETSSQSPSNMENRNTSNVLDSVVEVEETKREDSDRTQDSGTPEETYAPEIEIINKKSSGSSEESSRPTSKKGISKLFSRFSRKAKKSMSSSSD